MTRPLLLRTPLVRCAALTAAALAVPGAGCRESLTPESSAPRAEPTALVSPTPRSPPAKLPQTAEECKACNGVWGHTGVLPDESCNCRTHDGGKVCRDGDECEGMCVAADQPEREVVEAGPPARGFFVGRCSEFAAEFGCVILVERGATKGGPKPLDKPPARVCVE